MTSRDYQFDDEKGNKFNITVNHYHMTPENPLANLGNLMGQMVLMNAFAQRNELEEPSRKLRSLTTIGSKNLIESDSSKIEYEIHDDVKKYDHQIESLGTINGITMLKVNFEIPFDFDEFTRNYKDICLNVKYKLSVIKTENAEFIFEFNIKNIGKIRCAYISNTNYFTGLFNKFSNGRGVVSFKKSIAEKLNMPFLLELQNIDFIVDMENLFEMDYNYIDDKYKLKLLK